MGGGTHSIPKFSYGRGKDGKAERRILFTTSWFNSRQKSALSLLLTSPRAACLLLLLMLLVLHWKVLLRRWTTITRESIMWWKLKHFKIPYFIFLFFYIYLLKYIFTKVRNCPRWHTINKLEGPVWNVPCFRLKTSRGQHHISSLIYTSLCNSAHVWFSWILKYLYSFTLL